MSEFQTYSGNENFETGNMSFFQRVTGIVVSPEKVMKNLAARPRVLFPILMMVFAPVIFILTRQPLFEQMMREGMELGMQQQPNAGLTPEMIDMSIKVASVAITIALPIIFLLGWVISSAVVLGIVKLMKGQGRYKQILSVIGYSMVIMLLEFVIMYLISFYSGELTMTFSPALFITDIQGSYILGFLKGFLSSLDIFSIWGMVVTCIGIAAVSGLSKKKVYIVMFGIFAFFAFANAFIAGASATLM